VQKKLALGETFSGLGAYIIMVLAGWGWPSERKKG